MGGVLTRLSLLASNDFDFWLVTWLLTFVTIVCPYRALEYLVCVTQTAIHCEVSLD
jgi:hypothetical protein